MCRGQASPRNRIAVMRAPIFQLDSFTTKRFVGNPAAVVVLEEFLPVASMQAIAAENNLAETAFLVAAGTEHHLRWFTPTVEVKLCGHATLATAAVVMERLEPNREEVVFQSLSGAFDRSPFRLALCHGLPRSPIRSGRCARRSRRSSRGSAG